MARTLTVSKNFTFEASHILPKHPGKCSRLHGHSWGLTVSLTGPVDAETGLVFDYGEIARVVDTHVIRLLDHTHLGQGQAGQNKAYQCPFGLIFYPSSENLVVAIGLILKPFLPLLSEIRLRETCTCEAVWRP